MTRRTMYSSYNAKETREPHKVLKTEYHKTEYAFHFDSDV